MNAQDDLRFMRDAYFAAIPAIGNADPNPAVGALLVSATGEILAKGATERAGYRHAEKVALHGFEGVDLSQATLYVTLEPCNHHGRTPPCVDAIVARGVGRVVIAERDFAAEVEGRSVALLQERKVQTTVLDADAFSREAWFSTGPFFFTRRHGRPRITLKWAQTLDGKMAPSQGASGSISGAIAAEATAALRYLHKCTLATPGTVQKDSPRLTARFSASPSDFSHSGISPFLAALFAEQPKLAELCRGQETRIKPPQRVFWVDSQDTQALEALRQRQQGIDEHFHVFSSARSAWRSQFSECMNRLLQEILTQGYNSLLIEAGPVFSRLLLENGFVDAVAIYRSKTRTAKALWGESGRTNGFGDFTDTFEILETGDFGDDEFYYYRRRHA